MSAGNRDKQAVNRGGSVLGVRTLEDVSSQIKSVLLGKGTDYLDM